MGHPVRDPRQASASLHRRARGPSRTWSCISRPAWGLACRLAPAVWESARCGLLRPNSWRNPLSRPDSWTGLLPTVPGGAEWEGLPWEGAGVGSPGSLGRPGRGRKRPAHPPGMAPPGSLEPSGGRPPTPAPPPEAPGGPHFPSQPRVPSPGWTPVVWLRPMAVPALRSGKSLAPGHLRPLPLGPVRVSVQPDTHHRDQHVARCPHQHSQPCICGLRQERPLSSVISHSLTGGAGGLQGPHRGSPSLSPALGPASSVLSHPVSGKLPGPRQAG